MQPGVARVNSGFLLSGQNTGVQHIERSTGAAFFAQQAIRGANEKAIWILIQRVDRKTHCPSTICAAHKTGEYLRSSIFHLPATAGNLPLHLFIHFFRDDCFVGSQRCY